MEIEKRLQEGVWRWFNIEKDSSVCVVKAGDLPHGRFDYIVALKFPSFLNDVGKFIKELKSHLKSGGTLLLGFENTLGYRYFCGDVADSSKRYFTKSEIKNLLFSVGIKVFKFYSVLPDLTCAQLIYADSFVPTEDLSARYLPLYNNPEGVFKFEELGCRDLIENGLFHSMANSFLVECNDDGVFNEALQVTLSCDRGESRAFATIIKKSGTVDKKALFEQGGKSLVNLQKNLCELKSLGVKVVDGRLSDSIFEMPFVDAPLANVYLQKIAQTDTELFIEKMDIFRDLICKSAAGGTCYFDFVPLNAFYYNNDFIFFDQEFSLDVKKYPPEILVYRSLVIVYSDYERINSFVPIEFFWKRYGISDKLEALEALSHEFLMSLRSQDELKAFNSLHRRKDSLVRFNMNYFRKSRFYDELLSKDFLTCITDKKVCMFGSGCFAENFFSSYKNYCDVIQVVDNNPVKCGAGFHGVKISSPQVLANLDGDVCVVICVKDFKPVYDQLRAMNIKNVALYSAEKKCRVGYLSGVFDLFHIGHINMFRRAKEQCDYLIVGVTSDEYVINKKKRTPFIPCDERIQVIKACKYVDKVVKVSYMHEEITEAWETYHYDVQFCGSDYVNNSWWLEQQKWLREHGADLVFFPYTQQTSSTKIKALIEKGLL